MKNTVLLCLFIFLFISIVYSQYIICSDNHSYIIDSSNGYFGCESYSSQISESWLISSSNTTKKILITFLTFDTTPNDFVTIYDGDTIKSDILGSYSGSMIPGPFISTSNSILITFESDIHITGTGFLGSFTEYNGNIPCDSSNLVELQGYRGDFGCDGYSNNLFKQWHITGNSGERLSLLFHSFDTEYNYDILYVYNGSNNSSELIGEFSGDSLPPPFTSSYNELYLIFQTDSSNTNRGFSASWESLLEFSDICFNNTYTVEYLPFGYIGCPYGYGNNVYSTWLIDIIGNYIISLEFLSISTELNRDFIYIYDGYNDTYPLLGQYSGTTIPNTIQSSSNKMFIVFESDSSNISNGFTIKYNSIQQISHGTCSNSGIYYYTKPEGTIGCNGYNIDITIDWIINIESETDLVSLSFNFVDTELGHDIIYVYNGNSTNDPLLLSTSGSVIPDNIISSSNSLLIQLISDNNENTGTGFSATYETIYEAYDPSTCYIDYDFELTDLSNDIGCNSYGNNINITWNISLDNEFTIFLEFLSFNTQQGVDILSIYDGSSSHAPLLGYFSGSSLPPSISSKTNHLYLEFITDNSVIGEGFQATYSGIFYSADSLICTTSHSYLLKDNNGTFGCNGYSDDIQISWLINTDDNTIITIEFAQFSTELNYDFVSLYDGNSIYSPIVGTYSGNILPPPFHSSSNSLYILFTADGSVNNGGFTVNYYTTESNPSSVSPCYSSESLIESNKEGEFGCSGYTNNINSSWLIEAAENQRITLSFLSLDTELGNDIINIYDGSSYNNTLLLSISGHEKPNALTSTSSSLFVTFHTNESGTAGGFICDYISFGSFGDPCDSDDSYILTDVAGTFGCDGYENNIQVSWLIQTFGIIIVNFNKFDTEPIYDIMNIYDGPNSTYPLLGSFSGTTIDSIVSTGPSMYIIFTSDDSTVGSGFSGEYASII